MYPVVLDPGYARHKGLQGLGFRQMAMGIKRGGYCKCDEDSS